MGPMLAVLAALFFALGAVLQQRGTLETSAAEGDPSFLLQILRRPVWLAGGLLQVTGWVLQAAALDRGTLVAVQAVCTLSLVIALPLGARLTDQHIDRRAVIGALATVAGIVLFVVVGQPEGGITDPGSAAWWTAILACTGVIVGLALLARARHGGTAAALFAAAAGVGFGLQAAVTKVFVTQLGQGAVHLLSTWSTYVLIISALSGFALQQSALKTGFLAPAMAASNATTLTASVLLGVVVFQETLSAGDTRLWPAVVGLALAVVGVVTLAGSPGTIGSGGDAAPRATGRPA